MKLPLELAVCQSRLDSFNTSDFGILALIPKLAFSADIFYGFSLISWYRTGPIRREASRDREKVPDSKERGGFDAVVEKAKKNVGEFAN